MKKQVFILVTSILTGCTTYKGVVVKKSCCPSYLEVRISENHYLVPKVTPDDYDWFEIGDTIIIDRATFTICR